MMLAAALAGGLPALHTRNLGRTLGTLLVTEGIGMLLALFLIYSGGMGG